MSIRKKKDNIPRLVLTSSESHEFSSEEEEEDPDIEHNFMHKVHVLCNNVSELQNEADLAKMCSIYEAKQELNSKQIICFMTVKDLMKAKNTEGKVYLKLCPESPRRSRSSSVSPKISPKLSPKISLKISPKSDPLKSDISRSGSLDISKSGSLDISKSGSIDLDLNDNSKTESEKSELSRTDSASLQKRVNGRRSNSLNSSSNINIHRHLKPTILCSPDKPSNIANKQIILYDTSYNMSYNKTDTLYYIFIVEKKDNELFCRGALDCQIKTGDLTGYKSISVKYKLLDNNIDVTIYAPELISLKFPIYNNITTFNVECKIEQFVEMLSDLIILAHKEYANNL